MGVTGVGGIFLRSDDPERLAAWYREHLGIGAGEHGLWSQAAGPTVFSPFKRSSDYFPTDRAVMLNYRVEGLDALLTELRARGIAAETRAEWDMPGVGRFARIADCDGNPIELWEPDGD